MLKPQSGISICVICSLWLTGCFNNTSSATIEQSVQGLYDAALSADTNLSLVASIHHGASLWNLETQERVFNWNHKAGSYSSIDHVALSADGSTGLTSLSNQLIAWDSKTGRSIEFWQLPNDISCLSLSLTGDFALVTMSSGQAMVIDIKNNGYIWQSSFDHPITACHLDQNHQSMAIGLQSGSVSFFKIKQPVTAPNAKQHQWQVLPALQLQHPYAINFVQSDTAHNLLLSASQHHELWANRLGEEQPLYVKTLKHASVTAAVITDTMLLMATTARRIDVVNTQDWQVAHHLRVPKKNPWKPSGVFIKTIALYKNRLAVTSTDGVSYIYDFPPD